ncbi:MAG TPA: hypothetical protein VES88_09025 [Gemmatimonadaceae bacterium]|nr:hypothetical protein [Gemmatimonadaceae bacterium]
MVDFPGCEDYRGHDRPIGVFAEICAGGVVQSEFYQLRRTAIKDISAYCAFLLGFIGSAPFAWQFLSAQLESGEFVRGLWYFFALVTVTGLLCGSIGLALGVIAGWLWEQNHRRRRRRNQARPARAALPGSPEGDEPAAPPAYKTRPKTEDPADAPGLRLVPEDAPSTPDLSGRKLASIRFLSDRVELDFGGVTIQTTDSPVIVSGLQRYRYPDSGSRDALCGLIGASVEAMRAVSGEKIEIRFSAERQLFMSRVRTHD